MPTEYRFDELDLREEPAVVAKFEDEDALPTTYTQVSCQTRPTCRCTPTY